MVATSKYTGRDVPASSSSDDWVALNTGKACICCETSGARGGNGGGAAWRCVADTPVRRVGTEVRRLVSVPELRPLVLVLLSLPLSSLQLRRRRRRRSAEVRRWRRLGLGLSSVTLEAPLPEYTLYDPTLPESEPSSSNWYDKLSAIVAFKHAKLTKPLAFETGSTHACRRGVARGAFLKQG